MKVHYRSIMKTIRDIQTSAEMNNRRIDFIELDSHEMRELSVETTWLYKPEGSISMLYGITIKPLDEKKS